jgi:hypothetical protein
VAGLSADRLRAATRDGVSYFWCFVMQRSYT